MATKLSSNTLTDVPVNTTTNSETKNVIETKEPEVKNTNKKAIICISGDRNNNEFGPVLRVVFNELKNTLGVKFKVIFGDCTGVDATAKKLCMEMCIDYKVYPAEWTKYKRKAGPIRNKEMVDLANVVYAFHTDMKSSKGTKNTVLLANEKRIPVRVFTSTKVE